MSDPFLPDIQARIRQAFLLGLSRAPLTPPAGVASLVPAGKDPMLALLALTGQRQRFTPLPAVALDAVPDAARAMHQDPRPVLPPVARRAFVRLTGSVEKANAGPVISLAISRIARTGHRLHPFDLPELGRHARADADRLGMAERAYLALTATDADADDAKGLFFQRITDDNWTTFPKGQRREFLKEQRRADANAARALLESVWKTEPAPTRLTLLEALAVSLSADDKPFLETLAKDRAETVRNAAALLIARMPASEAYGARLAAAAACFTRPPKTGLAAFVKGLALGSQSSELQFALPAVPGKAAVPVHEMRRLASEQSVQLFSGLPLDALAAAVKATPEEIVTVLPADEHIVLDQFLETAKANEDHALVARIVATRLLMDAHLQTHLLSSMTQSSRVVLPPDTAKQVLKRPQWLAALAQITTQGQSKDDGRLVCVAAMMPREAVPAFVASLETVAPSVTRGARDFADLIASLPDAPALETPGAAA